MKMGIYPSNDTNAAGMVYILLLLDTFLGAKARQITINFRHVTHEIAIKCVNKQQKTTVKAVVLMHGGEEEIRTLETR